MPVSSSTQNYNKFASSKDAKLRLFALVIGIDKYQKFTNLTGAVADARDVERYLTEKLKVPVDHITTLHDREATREAIIKGFRDLQNDSRIKKNDAILIYFAGHGSESQAPDGWEAEGGKIQLILPQDTETMAAGKIVHAIPDRTVSALLQDLADVKGNNITVVLDCCHSHSGARGDIYNGFRLAELSNGLPSNLDRDIIESTRQSRSPYLDPIFFNHGLRSHVLLAACGSEERARESGNRGIFTKALVDTLRTRDVTKVTYKGLVKQLPKLLQQNPHCEGKHQDRPCFSATMLPFTTNNPEGDAHPVMARAHEKRLLDLSIIEMKVVFEKHTTRGSKPWLRRPVNAENTLKLKVHFVYEITEAFVLENGLEADPEFSLMKESGADLVVGIGNRMKNLPLMLFWTRVQQAQNISFERLALGTSADPVGIPRAVQLVAQWNEYFRCRGSCDFGKRVHVEFYRLQHVRDNFDGQAQEIWTPVRPTQDMNSEGVVTLVDNSRQYLGMKIFNDTDRDLYVNLVYLGVKNQTIRDYELGSTGKDKVDPPLRAHSFCTIGYGASGEAPFSFLRKMGKEDEVGFFKVFLTTFVADVDSLFTTSPSPSTRDPSQQDESEWGTVMVKIVEQAAKLPL